MSLFKANKRKRGWFKKAKKKYVIERIYRFNLYKKRGKESIERCIDDYVSIYYYSRDEEYQILDALKSMPFFKAFWKAREISKKKDSGWLFYYNERIKDI